MDNKTKRWIICLAVLAPLQLLVLFLIISGTVSFTVSGFGVDSQGRLYIGKPYDIEVYENNELCDSVPLPPNRTYVFMLEDETILLSNSSEQYVLSLNGTILDSGKDEGLFNDIERSYRHSKWKVLGENGHFYQRENTLGRYRFVKDDGEVVYKMPLLDYCAKVFLIIWIGLFLLGVKQIIMYFIRRP